MKMVFIYLVFGKMIKLVKAIEMSSELLEKKMQMKVLYLKHLNL